MFALDSQDGARRRDQRKKERMLLENKEDEEGPRKRRMMKEEKKKRRADLFDDEVLATEGVTIEVGDSSISVRNRVHDNKGKATGDTALGLLDDLTRLDLFFFFWCQQRNEKSKR